MSVISTPGASGSLSGVIVSGTAASGQVPVASSSSAGAWKYPPGFEVGYDQITSFVTIASTTEATGTPIITCGAHTFDGAAVLATFFAPAIQIANIQQLTATVCLFESTTEIGRLCAVSNATAIQDLYSGIGMLRFTPTAGSHTYTVTAFVSNSAATSGIVAGVGGTAAYPPAFIRFTKV